MRNITSRHCIYSYTIVGETYPLAWVSTVDPSSHFDYSYAHIYQSNVSYFVVESPTMVIFSLIISVRFKKSSTQYTVLVCIKGARAP